ncbi:MAG TPA: tetratricopeptide repeat protein, partial [Ktedonobacteraceae bacterium]|nr:tetratricopeptide repeat protein [Ktedonobacteraceae bacterium]
MLLLDTLSRLSSTCCWYTLDKSDADCAVFVRGLYSSIRCQFPTFGESFAALLETHTESAENGSLTSGEIELLASALIDALKHEIVQQFVLVLCNYQEVNECEAVNRLVDRLLSALPQWGTVIIESQGMPNLMVAPLIANRQMFGIGSQLLRFNQQEVYELARLQGFASFSLSEAEQLTRTFDGWIIGVLLGSRLGYTQGHHPTSLQATYWGETVFGGDHKQILEYITNKVFKHEAATYDFLRQVAIFTRLTPAYCNALLEINDAEERLIYAERRGLFLIKDRQNGDPSEAGDYICHPVLRQLFLEQLRQQTSDEYKALHKRAALILQTHHQYGQALMHAYQAQEYHFAAQIIIEGASTIIYEEHSEMIWHWLKMLPEEIFKQYPRLLLIASNIHLRHGEFALVPPLLDTVDALLNSGTEAEDVRASELLQAELFIARGHLSFFQGEFQRTRDFCQQALALLPPDERRLHIRAYQYKGIALIVGDGQIQEGIIQLQLALQMSRTQNNEQQIATLHRLVANAYSWIGNHTLAEHHQLRAFQIWEKLHNNQGIIYGLTSMGLLKMRQGFVADAETLLQRSLTLSRAHPPFKSGEAYALVGLGDLSNNQGKYAEALIYLEDGLNLARACEDHYLICCGICHLALAYLFLGDAQTAQFFLDQISLKDGEKLSFEGCLFALTQGTVFLTQQDNGNAQDTLLHASEITQRASIQILYVSTLLRLAVSYLRQNKKQLVAQIRQQIIELNNKGDFDFLIQVEIHRYTELAAFLE